MSTEAKADPVRALIGEFKTLAVVDNDGTYLLAAEKLEAALAQQAGAGDPVWTTAKPTEPGAYWVKGYAIGRPGEKALVEVRLIGGELCSNLHAVNSDNDTDDFDALARHNDNFQWLGPLVVAAQNNTESAR